jgi:hypothetical protein
LLTGGAYLDGTGLVVSPQLLGAQTNFGQVPNSAVFTVTTGDVLRVEADLTLPVWTQVGRAVAKWANTGPSRSFHFGLSATGAVTVSWLNSSAVLASATSTSVVPFSAGQRGWIGVTFDTDNAGSTTFDFETSTDGVSWSALGSQVVVAGTTDLQTTTTPVTVGNSFDSVGPLGGKAHRAIIRVNGTTQLDADFSTQTADALAFTESSTNAATVTINTTRYSLGLPGAAYNTVAATQSIAANFDYWFRFLVTEPIFVDMAAFEVTTGPSSAATVHIGLYAADANTNPVGAPLANFGPIAVDTSQTGTIYKQISPVSLTPGAYVLGFNTSVNISTRSMRSAHSALVLPLGANPIMRATTNARTNGTFPTSPTSFTNYTSSTIGWDHQVFLRWRPA